MVKRACKTPGCLGYGNDATYCDSCQSGKTRRKNYRRNHAPGDGAAKRFRSALNRDGSLVFCRGCRKYFYPREVEVDHIIPLHRGGLDVDHNLQALCVRCHHIKTEGERVARAQF